MQEIICPTLRIFWFVIRAKKKFPMKYQNSWLTLYIKSASIKMNVSIIYLFCVLKKWVHYRIGQCVRPAVRLHDNSSKAHPIVMKFCTQNCLINISVEFEDEKDWSRPSRVIAKNVIISYGFLCKNWPHLVFGETFSSHNQNKTSTIIYHSIENFTGYKMVYKTLRKNWWIDSIKDPQVVMLRKCPPENRPKTRDVAGENVYFWDLIISE